MAKQEKTFTFKPIPRVSIDVDVRLEKKEKGFVFAANAGEWNYQRKDYTRCGQCFETLVIEYPSLRKDTTFNTIYGLWKRNHLNDTHAGTKKQEEVINGLKGMGWRYDYDQAKQVLNVIGLDPDPETGERYGHAWYYQPISGNDLELIEKLGFDVNIEE